MNAPKVCFRKLINTLKKDFVSLCTITYIANLFCHATECHVGPKSKIAFHCLPYLFLVIPTVDNYWIRLFVIPRIIKGEVWVAVLYQSNPRAPSQFHPRPPVRANPCAFDLQWFFLFITRELGFWLLKAVFNIFNIFSVAHSSPWVKYSADLLLISWAKLD